MSSISTDSGFRDPQEYRDGRVAPETLRFVVVHASPPAQQQTQPYASAPAKEAEALADHGTWVQAQWLACVPDAEAAIAEYAGRGQGRIAAQAWGRVTCHVLPVSVPCFYGVRISAMTCLYRMTFPYR